MKDAAKLKTAFRGLLPLVNFTNAKTPELL